MIDNDPQTFVLREPMNTKKIKFVIENTNGGPNIGGNFKLLGFKCSNPDDDAKEEKKRQEAKTGIKEQTKQSANGCDDTADSMTTDDMIVDCVEQCDLNPDKVVEIDDGIYRMDSSICIAAKLFYKGKPEANLKKFGIKRVKNEKKLPDGSKPNYGFTFDIGITKPAVVFASNEEVDILDVQECYIRAVVEDVKGEIVNVKYNGQSKGYKLDSVFKCGIKLPHVECKQPPKQWKIKFGSKGAVKAMISNNLGDYIYDDGSLFSAKNGFT